MRKQEWGGERELELYGEEVAHVKRGLLKKILKQIKKTRKKRAARRARQA